MDKLSLTGLLTGLGGIAAAQFLGNGMLSFLFQSEAFLIVFCGTLGATMLHNPYDVFIKSISLVSWIFVPPTVAKRQWIDQIVFWCNIARKEGLLALDAHIAHAQDPFVRKGLQLLVDGNNADKIREVMEVEINTYDRSQWQYARVWESAAGYAPTIGILGAVLGLIQVMHNLGQPETLGAGIAVAFISTIYGVGLANLVFLPIAGKLKILIGQQVEMREMQVVGLMAIANGNNPRFVQSKLEGYLTK